MNVGNVAVSLAATIENMGLVILEKGQTGFATIWSNSAARSILGELLFESLSGRPDISSALEEALNRRGAELRMDVTNVVKTTPFLVRMFALSENHVGLHLHCAEFPYIQRETDVSRNVERAVEVFNRLPSSDRARERDSELALLQTLMTSTNARSISFNPSSAGLRPSSYDFVMQGQSLMPNALDDIPIAALHWDSPSGRCVYANYQARLLVLGDAPASLTALDMSELIAPPALDLVRRRAAEILQSLNNLRYSVVATLRKVSGDTVEMKVVMCKAPTSAAGLFVLVLNINE